MLVVVVRPVCIRLPCILLRALVLLGGRCAKNKTLASKMNKAQLAIYQLLVLFVQFLVVVLNITVSFPYELLGRLKKSRRCPPIKNDILLVSATKLADKIRKGEVTSKQVVTTYISRVKEVNTVLNAVIEDRFKEALEDADKADDIIRSKQYTEEELKLKFPILGLPVTIKNSIKVKDMLFLGGRKFKNPESRRATNDSDVVRQVKEAGGIVLLTSSCPELCISFDCSNKVIGSTCNPYDTRRTTGGSSGGEVSASEVIKAFIDRQKEVNPIINAVVENRYEDALAEAKEVDDFLAKSDLSEDDLENTKPLLGVPLTVKENLSLKGMSLAVGSKTRLGIKAEEDGDAVKRLREAGAIPLCVSNTPEFCMSMETYNFVTGATNNPYNTAHSCGGSSGGEGALVSSAASVIGIGSDIAGSIRIPSGFTGIFGHKPSKGAVSLKGHFPETTDPRFEEQLNVGPMVRYAEDLPLLLKIMAGENASKFNLDAPVDLSKLKVLFMEDNGSDFGMIPVDQHIKDAIKTSVEHLKTECESTISNVKFKELDCSPDVGIAMHFSLTGLPDPMANVSEFSELWKCIRGKSEYPFNTILYKIAHGNKTMIPGTLEDYDVYIKDLKDKMTAELGTNGVFLYPGFPVGAIPHYGSVYASVGCGYLAIFNMLGFPVTCVPVGFDGNGLPVSIQVVAAPEQDRLCMAVARELETLFGGWKAPY